VAPSEGCGSEAVCAEGNNVVVTGLTCHEDALCEVRDGRYGCHCPQGWYGNGIDNCVGKRRAYMQKHTGIFVSIICHLKIKHIQVFVIAVTIDEAKVYL